MSFAGISSSTVTVNLANGANTITTGAITNSTLNVTTGSGLDTLTMGTLSGAKVNWNDAGGTAEVLTYSVNTSGKALVLNALIPWSVSPRGPLWSGIEIIIVPIPFLATCAQYYLVGLLLDKLVEYWQRKSD